MIDALAELVVTFPGAANRTRCFTHILNLVVKVILCQFDVPKARADEAFDVASTALLDLAGDIESDEEIMERRNADDDDNDDGEEGLVDPRNGMSQEEQEELDATVRPVRLVLVKVSSNPDYATELYSHQLQLRKLAYTIKNSTTILLPRWIQILNDLRKNASDSESDPSPFE